MGMDRREFIRIAGLSTLLGLGGKGAFELLKPGKVEAEMMPEKAALQAKRWAMVVNMRKLDDATAQQCVAACHQVHNVPDYLNPPDDKLKLPPEIAHRYQIKWIWTDHYHNVFPGEEQAEHGGEGGAYELPARSATIATIRPASGCAPPRPPSSGKTASS